jgi:hypothetical protein
MLVATREILRHYLHNIWASFEPRQTVSKCAHSIPVSCISSLTRKNNSEVDLLVVWRCFGPVVEGSGVAKRQWVDRSEERIGFGTYVPAD